MYTIISGTNRPGSITRKFSEVYEEMLRATGAEVQYIHLEKLPEAVFHCDVYEKVKHPDVLQLQDRFARTEKYIFIFPEYNGSYPGILKLVVDVMDPRIAFHNKKAGMIGISTGRAGNLRLAGGARPHARPHVHRHAYRRRRGLVLRIPPAPVRYGGRPRQRHGQHLVSLLSGPAAS